MRSRKASTSFPPEMHSANHNIIPSWRNDAFFSPSHREEWESDALVPSIYAWGSSPKVVGSRDAFLNPIQREEREAGLAGSSVYKLLKDLEEKRDARLAKRANPYIFPDQYSDSSSHKQAPSTTSTEDEAMYKSNPSSYFGMGSHTSWGPQPDPTWSYEEKEFVNDNVDWSAGAAKNPSSPRGSQKSYTTSPHKDNSLFGDNVDWPADAANNPSSRPRRSYVPLTSSSSSPSPSIVGDSATPTTTNSESTTHPPFHPPYILALILYIGMFSHKISDALPTSIIYFLDTYIWLPIFIFILGDIACRPTGLIRFLFPEGISTSFNKARHYLLHTTLADMFSNFNDSVIAPIKARLPDLPSSEKVEKALFREKSETEVDLTLGGKSS